MADANDNVSGNETNQSQSSEGSNAGDPQQNTATESQGTQGTEAESTESGGEAQDAGESESDSSQPATRKSYHVGKRHGRQEAKQEMQQSGQTQQAQEAQQAEQPTDAQGNPIKEQVEEAIEPVKQELQEQKDEQRLKEFINNNPEFEEYEDEIRTHMKHPSRKQVPIKEVAYGVAGDDLLKKGAEKAKEADVKAKNSQSGGEQTSRTGGSKGGVWEMDDDEFQQRKNEVKRRGQ